MMRQVRERLLASQTCEVMADHDALVERLVDRLARPERFELPTPRFVVWCSIQLSYGR